MNLAQSFAARSAPTQIFWCAYLPLLRGYHDDQLVRSIIDLLKSSENYQIRLAVTRARMLSGKGGLAADVDHLLKEQPSNYGALMLKAQLLLSTGNFPEARDILKGLVSKSATRFKSGFLRWLAEANAGLGDAPAAEFSFSEAIRLASAAARPSFVNARGCSMRRSESMTKQKLTSRGLASKIRTYCGLTSTLEPFIASWETARVKSIFKLLYRRSLPIRGTFLLLGFLIT